MNLKKPISKILSLLILISSFSVTTLANPPGKDGDQPPPSKRRHIDEAHTDDDENLTDDENCAQEGRDFVAYLRSTVLDVSDKNAEEMQQPMPSVPDIGDVDRENIKAIHQEMPDKKIIYFCPTVQSVFSQIAFEEALRLYGVPFEHYEYEGRDDKKGVLTSESKRVDSGDPRDPVIYFGQNVKFSRRSAYPSVVDRKSPYSLTGYKLNCDIIICGSELSDQGCISRNQIQGKCILYKPAVKGPLAFSTNSIEKNLFVVGTYQNKTLTATPPITSGRNGFTAKRVHYLYGSGLMNDVFKNFDEPPFAQEPTLQDTLHFVAGIPDSKYVTRKKPDITKRPSALDSDTLLPKIYKANAVTSEPVSANILHIMSCMKNSFIIAFCPEVETYFSYESLKSALSSLALLGVSKDDAIVIYFGPKVVFVTPERETGENTLFGEIGERGQNYTIIFDESVFCGDSIIHHNMPNSRFIFYRPNLKYCGRSRFFYNNQCSQLFVLHKYDSDHPTTKLSFFEKNIPNGVYYLHYGDSSSIHKFLMDVSKISNATMFLLDSTAGLPNFVFFLQYVLRNSPEAVTK